MTEEEMKKDFEQWVVENKRRLDLYLHLWKNENIESVGSIKSWRADNGHRVSEQAMINFFKKEIADEITGALLNKITYTFDDFEGHSMIAGHLIIQKDKKDE